MRMDDAIVLNAVSNIGEWYGIFSFLHFVADSLKQLFGLTCLFTVWISLNFKSKTDNSILNWWMD